MVMEQAAAAPAEKAKMLKEMAEPVDVLAWARQEIFPTFNTNRLSAWPQPWQHGDAKALDILRGLTARFKTLSVTVQTFGVDKEGRETPQGRDWSVVLDATKGAYVSRRKGEDLVEICDGQTRAQLFPLLKYAARRQAAPEDLLALGNALPGWLCPWADKLDRDFVASVQSEDANGLVLKLQRRNNPNEYMLVYLAAAQGPVTKVEIFRPRRQGNQVEAYKAETVMFENVQEIGGVRLATVLRTIRHDQADKQPMVIEMDGRKVAIPAQARDAKELMALAAAMKQAAENPEMAAKLAEMQKRIGVLQAAAEGLATVVRLTNVAVGGELAADTFTIEIPADWAVRTLDTQPAGADRRGISAPYEPSPHMGGPGRFRGEALRMIEIACDAGARVVVAGPDLDRKAAPDHLAQAGQAFGQPGGILEQGAAGRAQGHPAVWAAQVDIEMPRPGRLGRHGGSQQRLAVPADQLDHQGDHAVTVGRLIMINGGKGAV